MFHRVILLHGVENIAGRAHWTDKLEARWQSQGVPFRLSSFSYGGLLLDRSSAALTWLPWYRKSLAMRAIKSLAEIEKYLANFSRVDGRLSFIAHSFGGQIVQQALEGGWKVHRAILLASAMDEEFDFNKFDSQFDAIHIFWSPADEVIRWAYYGRQGQRGPAVPHRRVYDHRRDGFRHNDWTTDRNINRMAAFWRAMLES